MESLLRLDTCLLRVAHTETVTNTPLSRTITSTYCLSVFASDSKSTDVPNTLEASLLSTFVGSVDLRLQADSCAGYALANLVGLNEICMVHENADEPRIVST